MKSKIEKLYQWKLANRTPHESRNREILGIREAIGSIDSGPLKGIEKHEKEVRLETLRLRWEKIAGPLSPYSIPLKYTDGILIVNVEKPIYIQELMFHQSGIIKNIKQYTGLSVVKIRCNVGPVSHHPEKPPEKTRIEDGESLSQEKKEFLDQLRKLKS